MSTRAARCRPFTRRRETPRPLLAPTLRAAAVTAALAWAVLPAPAPAQDVHAVIGASLPLTGQASVYGRELQAGARACLAATSGAKTIQLEVMDDAGDPKRVEQNLRSLAGNARLMAVLGTFGTESTAAALPVLKEGRLAMVGPASGSESLRAQNNRYVFHLRASHKDEAAAIVAQLAELGIQEVAVVHSNDALGQEGLEGTRIEIVRLSLKTSAVVTLDAAGSLSAAALKMLINAAPPAIILIAHHAQAAQFISQLRGTSLRPAITAVSEAAGELMFEKVGAGARGVGLVQVMPHPWSANLPITRFYQAAMNAAGQNKLGYYSFEGCAQMRVVLEGLRRAARPLSRERTLTALEGEFDLGGLRFEFAPDKRSGGRFVEMTVINHAGRVIR